MYRNVLQIKPSDQTDAQVDASRRKSTHVFDLRFVRPPTCVDLRWLDFGRDQFVRKSTQAPFGHPMQIDTRWSKVICIFVKFTTCLNLRVRLAIPRKSVRKFWFCKLAFRLATHVSFWSRLNSYASRRKFFTVWPPNASRHMLITSQHTWNLGLLQLAWTCEPTCESVWPPIASL